MMNMFRLLWQNNSLDAWLTALTLACVALAILLVVRRVLVARIRRWAAQTETYWDDTLVDVIAATHSLTLGVLSVYIGARVLEMPPRFDALLDRLLVVVLMMQLGIWGTRGIRTWMRESIQRCNGEGAEAMHLGIIGFIASLALWVVVLLATLNNLGFDITALVASLGIGGVAVALAVQNILGDLFASLSIALDKPFVVGDFIVIDDLMGTVKHVGLKTTRIQSLGGEELIFSNNDLLKSRIRNYKRMAERRVVFGFGLSYDTREETLAELPARVRGIVEAQQDVRFDRAHFKGFGQSSLDFEVVYYVLNPDYGRYMDVQQAINLALVREVKALGAAFAFPTRTLHLASVPLPHAA